MPSGSGMLAFGSLCCVTTLLGFTSPGFFIIGWVFLLFTVLCLVLD